MNNIKKQKTEIQNIIGQIPIVLSDHQIKFTSQGKYEFVVKDHTKKEIEKLLTTIPSFNKFCNVYAEGKYTYIRIKFI